MRAYRTDMAEATTMTQTFSADGLRRLLDYERQLVTTT